MLALISHLPSEDLVGYLLLGGLIVVLIGLIIVYVILPLTALVCAAGACYGGFVALENYAKAFLEVTIEGNRR